MQEGVPERGTSSLFFRHGHSARLFIFTKKFIDIETYINFAP